MFKSTKINMLYAGCTGYDSLTLHGHICWRRRFDKSPKRSLVREEQWQAWWRAAVVGTYTLLSHSLSRLEAKPSAVGIGWVFCFNTAQTLTCDFVEMIHEKPCVSSIVKCLSCNQNTCVYSLPQPEVVPSSRLVVAVPLSVSSLL